MTKQAFKHDFDGSCIPVKGLTFPSQKTFSVGIFQWVPKASGNGLKKTPVKYRVFGLITQPESVFARAREICAAMDSGEWKSNKKSERV